MVDLFIQDTPTMGRGVFANKQFATGDTIEICPAAVIGKVQDIAPDVLALMKTYIFGWNDYVLICGGFGTFYNHSEIPNSSWVFDQDAATITFTALSDINSGDQIFFDYGFTPSNP